MQSRHTADAVVIGGGAIGCAVAYYLAKAKVGKVILVERNSIGSGNTSWAASLLTKIRSKQQLIPLVQETYRAIEALEQENQTSIGLRQVGSLHLAASAATEEQLNNLTSIARAFDIPYQSVDHKEVQKMLPWIAVEELRKSIFMPEDAFQDAYVLANSYASFASRRGVKIWQNKTVTHIHHKRSRIEGVQLKNDSISSPIVVDAAGAWANLLSLELGIPLPMAPVRSNYWITETNPILFPPEQPITILPDASAYARPETGALLFGLREKTSVHFDPQELPTDLQGFTFGDPEDKWTILLEQGAMLHRFFPEFENIGIAHYISGLSTYTPDGLFVLGNFPGMEGFFAATGCSGAGVAASGGMGRAIAELISGETPFCPLDSFRIDRFGDIDPLSTSFRQICADARSNKKSG